MKPSSILAFLFIFMLSPLAASAVGYNSHNGKTRSGKTEFSFKVNYLDSWEIDGENLSSVDINTDVGFGFEIGYNYSEHLKFSYEFNYNSPGYTATAIDEDTGDELVFRKSLDILNSQFNVTYNFSTGQFTPFVGAGIGWAYMDSNISSGYNGGGCYWDPWWGYICTGYNTTYDSYNFAYNAKAGVRYDLDKSLYLSAAYAQNWYDFSHAKTGTTGQLQIEIGMKY